MNSVFELALSFDDVLLKPRYSPLSSRSEVDLTTKISDKLTLTNPLIPTNMDTVTGVKMAIRAAELGSMAIIPRFETVLEQAKKVETVAEKVKVVAASVGVKEIELERAEVLVKAGVTVLDIDAAHGHLQKVLDTTKILKQKYGSKVTILAGIAATYEAACDLYKAGADCVTVGVGGGSICTTRTQTGCGLPTFASLLEVSKAAKKYNKTFMPLAGLKISGDAVKSLAKGACAVRGGNLFAGALETPGDLVTIRGAQYKHYNGSTSFLEKTKQVKKDSKGKTKEYTIHIEGVAGLVKYKGTLDEIFNNQLAGIKSGLSYCGAKNLKELVKNAQFVQISGAGITENRPHDLASFSKN